VGLSAEPWQRVPVCIPPKRANDTAEVTVDSTSQYAVSLEEQGYFIGPEARSSARSGGDTPISRSDA
jgi:hypothetical protein